VILTLTFEALDKPQRTWWLSSRALIACKVSLGLFILAVGAAIIIGIARVQLLERRAEELAERLSLRNHQLAASRARLAEVRLATEELFGELGILGARLREVRSLAGLPSEPPSGGEIDSGDAPTGISLGRSEAAAVAAELMGLESSDLEELLGTARSELRGFEGEVRETGDILSYRQAVREATPHSWPVKGWISSHFGLRRSPISGKPLMHKGIDIAASLGTPVSVTAPGEVVEAGWSNSGFGLFVMVDHGYGFKTLYGHLSEVSVERGERLALGDTVGLIGSTGYSTGPHLHYQVIKDDQPIDPIDFLPADE